MSCSVDQEKVISAAKEAVRIAKEAQKKAQQEAIAATEDAVQTAEEHFDNVSACQKKSPETLKSEKKSKERKENMVESLKKPYSKNCINEYRNGMIKIHFKYVLTL